MAECNWYERTTVNSEKIALVKFLRSASDAKLKFVTISAATLSVELALHVTANSQS